MTNLGGLFIMAYPVVLTRQRRVFCSVARPRLLWRLGPDRFCPGLALLVIGLAGLYDWVPAKLILIQVFSTIVNLDLGVLTYMSIRTEIVSRISEGRLFLLEPKAPGAGVTRVLLMTQPLKDDLESTLANQEDQKRFGVLRADLEHFVTGSLIDPKYMKKLKKTEEVWTIRSPRPRPGIRIFGRFAEFDVFVATHHYHRLPLSGFDSIEWRREIRRCKAGWRRYFPTYEPHTGRDINDYVSNAADPKLFE